jgi:FkbM family methyltransferase
MGGRLKTYRRLRAGGVRASSLLLYPVRRRLPRPYNLLQLEHGESFRSPPDEELLTLIEEVWIDERYLPGDFKPPCKTVVDVGANVGVFTIWAARRLGARRILAIEPAPDTARQLRENLRRNGVRAEVLQAAVGGASGERILYRRGAPGRDTLFSTDNYASRFEALAPVRVLTLDEVVSSLQVKSCDLLKLDCEGAEYEILEASSEATLAKVRHLVAEYHVGLNELGPEQLRRILERRGFDVTIFPPLDVEGGHLHATRRI